MNMTYTTNPYAELSQLYSALDSSTTVQNADGTWLQELLVEAQDYLDNEIGYKFQTDGTTGSPALRLYDGNEEDKIREPDVLFVGSEHIISITQVLEVVQGIVVADGVFEDTAITSNDITSDIQLQPNNSPDGYWKMKRKSGIPFYQGVANYKVSGVFGRTRIPSDISRACVRLAVHYYKMRDTNYADQVMEQGLVRMKYTKEVPTDVQQIIDKHKSRVFFAGSARG